MATATLLGELVQPEVIADALPWGLSFAEKQTTISHEGNLARLSCLVQRLEAGGSVKMAVLGGSVSAGTSMRVRPDQRGLFHRKLQRWLEAKFPQVNVSHTNAAMPAVPPAYMEQCLRLHIPADVDLVLMEAAANMCSLHDCATGM
eukprot:3601382-Prymnesium_polylepis.1